MTWFSQRLFRKRCFAEKSNMGSGDPMLHNTVRLTALAGCAVGVLLIAGCGAREPVEAPPPASVASGYSAPETPELMGAPPVDSAPADGLLGGPVDSVRPSTRPASVTTGDGSRLKTWRRPDGALVTAMAPIANPTAGRRAVHDAPRAVAAPARHRTYAAAPAPKPVVKAVAQPVGKPAAKPAAVAPAPAPLKPVVAAKPVAPLAKAPTPVLAAAAPPRAAPAQPLSKLQQLQAAVAPEATKGAVMASGESLAKGQEGQVTLSLPATLGDLIKKEAQKLGLAKAAKKTSAYADLRGEGYEITPNGRQTAVVKPGEPATFAWNVKPTPDAKGSLTTEFGVALNGAKPAQGFSLGAIAKQVVPAAEKVEEAAKGFKLTLPNLGRFETIDVPGLGKMPGKSVLGGALVLLALLILVVIARGASAAQARIERRRKFRTQTDYGRNEMEFEPPRTANVGYVSPMVAAAGGAVAGAAVASTVGHGHDDPAPAPAPAPAEHNPFETPIQGQAHDAHAVAAPFNAEAPAVSHDPFEAPTESHGHAGHKELEPTH
jgi:hypothetical protein